MVADIIINITAKQVQQTFSYTIPDGLSVRIGSRVLVPFGPRREEGIVLAVREERDSDRQYQLKPILALLSSQAGFQEEMIQTAVWISQYYLCGLADALRLFMIEKKGIIRRVYLKTGPVLPVTEEERAVAAYVDARGKAEKGRCAVNFPPIASRRWSDSISWTRRIISRIRLPIKWKNGWFSSPMIRRVS